MFVRDSCSKQLDSDRLAAYVPELLRVTGPLPSLVLRAEDIWLRYKPFFIEVFGILNQGFPISSLV